MHTNEYMFVSVILLHANEYKYDGQARVAREKNFGVYRDFGQCSGENGSSVKGYYSNRLAGMHLVRIYR